MLEESKFENILSSLRVRKGKAWTQQKTADELGVSVRTYKGWERGERVPDHRDLKNIAALFSLDTAAEAELYLAASQAPPKIHNLPFPRNPFFTGREEHLKRLREQLQTTGTAAITQPISISGLGGIGKTQLALEYAHCSYPNVYRAVFWVDAADEETLQASYDTLAHLLELPERQARELYERIQAVKRWLETHRNWLLIMDNADDLPLARSFLPAKPLGHIVLTTRSQIVGNIARRIEIEKMEQAEGVLFLLRRSGVLQDEAELDTVAPDIRGAALMVVKLLGGHPLALDQAGAYIDEADVSLADYIQLYQKEPSFLLDRRASPKGTHEHPESVVKTVLLSLSKVDERHPRALDVLCFCSFLPSHQIQEDLFYEDEILELDTKSFNDTITVLRGYSLIKRNTQDKTLSMHRLVQAVLIEMLTPELRTQAKELVDFSKILRWASNLYGMARFYVHTGKYEGEFWSEFGGAENCYHHALRIREDLLGATHPRTQEIRQDYAAFLHIIGHHAEAAALEANGEPPV